MVKKPTSVRLNSDNEAKLKALAKRDNLAVSQVINKIINEYSGKKEESSTTVNIDQEIYKRISTLEKEQAMQRQRINILKNQIDFLIKSQNGKGRTDRYTSDSKPKQSLEKFEQ